MTHEVINGEHSQHASITPHTVFVRNSCKPPVTPTSVTEDLRSFRQKMDEHAIDLKAFATPNPWHVLMQLSVDWLLIAAAWRMVMQPQVGTIIVAAIIVGSRQRALGNLLHDASHYLLCTNKRINDVVAQLCLALPMGASIREYRRVHFQHHAHLGNRESDPDFFATRVFRNGGNTALRAYAHMAVDWRYWFENGFGGLLRRHVRMRIAAWWGTVWTLLYLASDATAAFAFVGLWFGCRLTTFHLITSFREICDHTGLTPGGIFSYTRNVIGTPLLNQIFHPHDNGYHLLHHLAPAIPSHKLAAAHRALGIMPAYASQSHHCDGYFTGRHPVIACWIERMRRDA